MEGPANTRNRIHSLQLPLHPSSKDGWSDETGGGSKLDAGHPARGVNIPRRNTARVPYRENRAYTPEDKCNSVGLIQGHVKFLARCNDGPPHPRRRCMNRVRPVLPEGDTYVKANPKTAPTDRSSR